MASRAARRPFVAANFAMTWDGRVSTRNRTPSDFSSPTDKRRLLEIRSGGDAVLAGARTIEADNMTMGLPAEDLRAARLAKGQPAYPLRVLITNSGRLNPAMSLFQKDFSPVVIFSTRQMPAAVVSELESKATLYLEDAPQVDLAKMLATLRSEYRINRLVCEGGPTLLRSLLEAGLVDELHLTLCPKIFGGAGAPTLSGIAESFPAKSTKLSLSEMEVVDGECFLRYRVLRP